VESDIERLRGYSRNINLFWLVILFFSLLIATLSTFLPAPRLLGQPRGWAMLALTLAFALVYWRGFWWSTSRNRYSYWRERVCKPNAIHWGIVLAWALLLGTTVALILLSSNYAWLLFSVYGMSFAVMPLPRSLVLSVPTALIMFTIFGWLPKDTRPETLLATASSVLTFVIISFISYLPYMLLMGRFERERVYAELQRSHRELAEAHRQLEASAARDRELAVLRERGRLARDMHDTLGHSLVLIAVKLEAAQRLRSVDATRADHEIGATQEIVRNTMMELRTSIADLRSAQPPAEPLGEALARLAYEAGARAGWQVTCDVAPEVGPLDVQTAEALLRMGSEALANVERHAHARAVRLVLAREGCAVVLRVEDDGVGILSTNPPREPAPARTPAAVAAAGGKVPGWSAATDSEAPVEISSPPGHYGIRGMRERVSALGGTFAIGPASAGKGTAVEARVPAGSL
jgi:signal transduction histidine kinase